jgi:hypothetical protein
LIYKEGTEEMKKLLIAASALAMAVTLVAEEYASVSFQTTGPDKYADGTTVLDGECYALVWTADGVFEGLNVDGSCVDPADEVVAALPWAKDGAFPATMFNIATNTKYVAGGELAVYLLDTRKFIDGEAKVSGVNAEGKLVFVNASSKVDEAVTVSGAGAAPSAKAAAAGAVEGAVASALPADVPMPKVTGLDFVKVNGSDYVKLTVGNTVGFANYAVQGGNSVAVDGAVGADAKTGGAESITLLYPKTSDANFFKVIRK